MHVRQSPNLARPTQGFWVLFATILASSMAFIDGTALNVALPVLQADLGASGSELLWIHNSYLVMLAALILIGGALGDRLGRKRVFAYGIGLFLMASLVCGLAPNTAWLIAARLLQGLGGALMIPGSLALISATFSGAERGRAIGTWSAVSTMVTIAGPLLGGLLADAGLWRVVFLINLPLGLLALAALVLRVPETRDTTLRGPLDYAGAVLIAGGLAALTYGFLTAPERGFADWQVWGSLSLAVIMLVGFGLVEARTSAPMMPFRLFSSSTFRGANLLTLFLYGAIAVGPFFLSLNLVQAQGYPPSAAGLAMLPLAIILTLLSRWMGGLADRFGPRLLLVVGSSLTGMAFLWLAQVGATAGVDAYWTTFFPGMVLFGLGMSMVVAPLSASVMGAVGAHFAGTASGINNAVSRIAGVLAIAIIGALALSLFSAELTALSQRLNLDATMQAALLAEANQLGAAQPPEGLEPAVAGAIRDAIRQALIASYQTVQLICAGLAFASAVAAAVLIKAGEAVVE